MFFFYCFQTTASQSNVFDHLINIWEFNPGPIPGTCDLHFFVDFKFQSPLYRQVNLSLLFSLYFLSLLCYSLLYYIVCLFVSYVDQTYGCGMLCQYRIVPCCKIILLVSWVQNILAHASSFSLVSKNNYFFSLV